MGSLLKSTKYHLSITFTEPLLGSQPGRETPASDHVRDKVRSILLKKAMKEYDDQEKAEQEVDKIIQEEETTLEAAMEKTMTIFHKENGVPILFNYQIKGFLKECAEALNGLNGFKALKNKVEKAIFVTPRRIPIDGEYAENALERPLRAMTQQGPRVSLAKSEVIKPGAKVECVLEVIDLPKISFDEDIIETLMDYGLRKGMGQWRNSGFYGQFEFELRKVA